MNYCKAKSLRALPNFLHFLKTRVLPKANIMQRRFLFAKIENIDIDIDDDTDDDIDDDI